MIFAPLAKAESKLSNNIRFKSTILSYDLHFRLYLPGGYDKSKSYPVLYVVDGQWYLGQGEMKQLLDKMIANKDIQPIITVFIDSRNPDKKRINRRNQQFMCNAKYASFFKQELVPFVQNKYNGSTLPKENTILGLSFGGLNSACFGLMIPDVFGNIAMQSPASAKHLKLLQELYKKNPKQPLKVFMSLGSKRDNTAEGRKFMRVLKNKKYDLTYKEVPFGHNWKNWKPLLDDILLTFYQP